MISEKMTRSNGPSGNITSRMLGQPPPPYSDLHNYASSLPRDTPTQPGHVSEHCLQTDLELPIYPGSPSSFYMYEQERKDLNDMHTSLGAIDCSSVGSPCTSSVTESVPGVDLMDLDLETPLDWNSLLNMSFSKMGNEEPVHTDWEMSTQQQKWEHALQCSSGMETQPTLAELNDDCLREELDLFNLRTTVQIKEEPVSVSCSSAQRQIASLVMAAGGKPTFTALVPRNYPKCHTATSPSTVTPSNTTLCSVAGQPIKCTMTGLFQMVSADATSNPMNVGQISVPVATTLGLLMPKTEPAWDMEYNMCSGTQIKRSISPENTSCSSINKKWEEIKQFIHEDAVAAAAAAAECKANAIGPPSLDTGQMTNTRKRTCSDNSDMTFSIDGDDSQAEGFDSDYDSDYDCQTDYGAEGLGIEDEDICLPTYGEVLAEKGVFVMPQTKQNTSREKTRRYFWQYNTQSKGPKGERLCKKVGNIDPHVLNNFEDPVFDPDLGQAGPTRYKHNGKARKGDGNDVTPNPYKLYQIGGELKQLDRTINDIAPPGELPCNIRPKSRKEKNKLASRACRLKKKAQHEANKAKLFGLDTEHHQLMTVLEGIRGELVKCVQTKADGGKFNMAEKFQRLIKTHTGEMVSGNTTDYVNAVLQKVASGDRSGGLK